jgi:hypothetical protein
VLHDNLRDASRLERRTEMCVCLTLPAREASGLFFAGRH